MNSMIDKIDENNMKALSIVNTLLFAVEHSHDDIDYISIVSVIRDYLQSNNELFDKYK